MRLRFNGLLARFGMKRSWPCECVCVWYCDMGEFIECARDLFFVSFTFSSVWNFSFREEEKSNETIIVPKVFQRCCVNAVFFFCRIRIRTSWWVSCANRFIHFFFHLFCKYCSSFSFRQFLVVRYIHFSLLAWSTGILKIGNDIGPESRNIAIECKFHIGER